MIVWYQNRTLYVTEGRKWLNCLAIESAGLTTVKIARDRLREMTPLTYRGEPYPASRARRHYKRIARQAGATKAAKNLMKKL